ncbi:hypothetical protein ACIPLC_37455 [Kitasatospora sp. NPDC086801]|uniref:hypothetical protein n=1 Tax=Kitasatospora sp. NPDC086801 TaxID=3364066 RepID=UPI00380D9058
MNATIAWKSSTGEGVIVALVDSGVQADAALTGPRLPAVDFTGSGTPDTDDDQVLSHGTMMAALISGARGLPVLRSAHPDWDAPRVVAHLRNTARPPHDNPDKYGSGLLAPDLALTQPDNPTNPSR